MSDAATKADLTKLGKRLDKKIDALDAKFDKKIDDLDKKFDSKFDILDKKIDNSFDDLTTLLKTFMAQADERFSAIEAEQRQIRRDMNRLFDYMDKIAKKQEISDEERLVIGHQLERLDRWTHELADRIGYTLSA